jgi:hypothetical protein
VVDIYFGQRRNISGQKLRSIMSFKKRFWFFIRLFIYITGFIIMLWIPWRYIAGGPVICLFRRFFGINCPGCGMTRACWQIIHLNFRQALSYNIFSMLVFPVGVFLVGRDIYQGIKDFWSE